MIKQATGLVAAGDLFENAQATGDGGPLLVAGVLTLVALSVVLLVIETAREPKRRFWVLLSGILSVLLLALCVLRPTVLHQAGREVPGFAVALVDASHRLALPGQGEQPRHRAAQEALERLRAHLGNTRLEVAYFDQPSEATGPASAPDLMDALRDVLSQQAQRPSAVFLLTDGRLTRPSAPSGELWDQAMRDVSQGVPVHTIRLLDKSPVDRSIRALGLTGSAVAHQPLSLNIEVGCEPAETCNNVEVVARELLEGHPPQELARGETSSSSGLSKLELNITLERAGERVIEVELLSDQADAVVENDKRIVPVRVRRERLRMLHVAGRPTYDVRALRRFLKSDESIDLISFFILRTPADDVQARQDELALIPFPVRELFTDHLKSFDAVVLQDIDGPRYDLHRHFRSIKDYVLKGGGLIMVGGPTSFSSGGYAGTPIADILPVELLAGQEVITHKPFVPKYTAAGRAAPILHNLQLTMGQQLPAMDGANLLGAPRPGASVLWEHPSLTVPDQPDQPMPVLALAEVGDGRTVAISVDGSHQLRFGAVGARTGGRGYADLWEGLLGWLMRDPRYETAQIRLPGACIAGQDRTLEVELPPSSTETVRVELERLGLVTSGARLLAPTEGGKGQLFLARRLSAGGYAARVTVGQAPPTRFVFACEAGGQDWADSRPDPDRLRAIARATGGRSVTVGELSSLEPPAAAFVSTHRESRPLLPSWWWAMGAAFMLSAHWLLRRASGHA